MPSQQDDTQIGSERTPQHASGSATADAADAEQPQRQQQTGQCGRGLLDRLPRWVDPLLVLLVAAAVFLPRLGSYGLHDPWETHYGEVARNMLESGDWISPWWGAYWPEGEPCVRDAECPPDHVCRSIRSEYLPHQATCRPSNISREGEYFFSKPVLSMWIMALSMSVFGVGEWGVRLPFVLLATLALLAVALTVRAFFDRRRGLLAPLLLLGTPLFFFISRQAMTDSPFVSLLILGMCFFMLGMFGPERPVPRRLRWVFAVGLTALVLPQALLLAFDLKVYIRTGGYKILVGALHGGAYLILLGLMLRFTWRATSTRQIYLWTFYALVGLASMAKGLLGIALPGAIILLYMIVTWRGRWLLRRAELLKGTMVFAAVAFPWYGAMFARHLRGFFDRFFIHDHFKRLAAGVHHLDSGGFEYVLLWLGLGLFPWIGFLPAALTWAATRKSTAGAGSESPARGAATGAADGYDRSSFVLLTVLWFLVPFTLFSLSSTKFHHYVYPLVPPSMILIALLLDRLVDGLDRARLALLLLLALGLNGLVAWNLAEDPQRLVNLFTYKYDRAWPPELEFGPLLAAFGLAAALPLLAWLRSSSTLLASAAVLGLAGIAASVPPDLLPLERTAQTLADALGTGSLGPLARALAALVAGAAGAALLALHRPVRRRLALVGSPGLLLGVAPLVALALSAAIWSQSGYLYSLSNRWTQARIFDAYRASCTPVQPEQRTHAGHLRCVEDLTAYKMNWRGETFYSENTVIPLLSDKEARYFLSTDAGEKRFFAIVEYTRLQGQFRPLLSNERWRKVRRVYEGNTKFVLLDVPAEQP